MTNSELILLSLIAEKPRHGYEIETVIEERGMRNWTEIAFSSIYFLLGKLVKNGLASSVMTPAAGRGPTRKVFSITPSGMDALRDGVLESVRNPDWGNQAFLFGLSCLPMLGHEGSLEALEARRNALEQKKDELAQNLAVNLTAFPAHVAAMFTYSLAVLQANLDWLTGYITQLRKGDPYHGEN